MADIISRQLYLFLISVVSGIGIGLWYEVFRSLRKKVKHSGWQVQLEDVVFVLAAAVGIFILFQKYNYGSVRFYAFLGMILGGIFYFSALDILTVSFMGLMWDTLFLFGKLLFTFCVLPFKIIVNSLVKSLKKTAETVRIIKSKK